MKGYLLHGRGLGVHLISYSQWSPETTGAFLVYVQGSWSHPLKIIQLGSAEAWKKTWIFLDCSSRLVPRWRASKNL